MEHSIIDYILHNGDLHDCIEYSKEYKKIAKRRYELHDKLRDMLTEEQKEHFDKFVNLEIDETALSNEAYFKSGVKLAARFMAESMFD